MNDNDISDLDEMARQAGLSHYLTVRDFPKLLRQFARIVAARENEGCAAACEPFIGTTKIAQAERIQSAIRARMPLFEGSKATHRVLSFD